MASSNSCFLTCILIFQETGKVVWYSHLLKNFPQIVVIHTSQSLEHSQWSRSDVFLEFPCFLYDPMNVGNLNSGSSALSKSSLYSWKFSVRILLKSHLKDFEHNLTSMWNERSCTVLWSFFGIALLWDWKSQPSGLLKILVFILTGMEMVRYVTVWWIEWRSARRSMEQSRRRIFGQGNHCPKGSWRYGKEDKDNSPSGLRISNFNRITWRPC